MVITQKIIPIFTVLLMVYNVFATVSVRIFSMDEGLAEGNISKPRIYIENNGTEPISNFYYHYFITTENGKQPQVDPYYIPNAVHTIEELGGEEYRIKYDYNGTTLQPGQILPNTNGNVIGIHYADWGLYDKTNDRSNNLSATFQLNANIPVFLADGTQIYGSGIPGVEPETTIPEAIASTLGDYVIFTREATDIRDRVQIVNGTVGSAVYLEVGADAIVNGSLFSGGNIFLRERANIGGDVNSGGIVVKQNGVVINGLTKQNATLEFPAIDHFATEYGTENINVWDDQAYDLAPGSYNEFHAYSRSTIRIQPGIYKFRKFHLETDVNLVFYVNQGQCADIFAGEALRFGDRTKMSFANGALLPLSVKFSTNQTNPLFIGPGSIIYGLFKAPEAEIHVYSGTNVKGLLYGKRVIIEPDVIVCKPPTLTDISHSEGAMAPPFDPLVFEYVAVVPMAITSMVVKPEVRVGHSVKVNGNSPSTPVNLTSDKTEISIVVSDSAGCGSMSYKLSVKRSTDYCIFVNIASKCPVGSETGKSWAYGYKDLQIAINEASIAGKEIRIAEGTYVPQMLLDPADPRSAAFVIPSGCEIYGGFKGINEDEKIPTIPRYTTILSGDINGDDRSCTVWPPATVSDQQYVNDNAYHVVTIKGNGSSNISLNNIIIEHGVANGLGKNSIGGGVIVLSGAPNFEFVGIKNNISEKGGAGVSVLQGSGINYFRHCLFEHNVSMSETGGAVNYKSDKPVLFYACIFDENETRDSSVSSGGAGIYFNNSHATIINALFCNNSSAGKGASLYAYGSSLVVSNCTFAQNNGVKGIGGIRNINGSVMVLNSILWNFNGELEGNGITTNYSDVKGGYAGTGNIDANPYFLGTGSWPPEGPDGYFGGVDDAFRLGSSSPCIRTGSVIGGPEADLLDIEYDGNTIEMGAYKFFEINNSTNCKFGRIDVFGNFYEYTPSIVHGLKFPSDIRIWAGSNSACVVRAYIDKDKRLKNKSQFTLWVHGMDESENNIPGAVDIPVEMYKVGEENGKYVFQSKTATKGKNVIFSGNPICQTATNPHAYVICTRALNFDVYTK